MTSPIHDSPVVLPEVDAADSTAAPSESLAEQAPQANRRYQVHGEIARGGMGAILEVWEKRESLRGLRFTHQAPFLRHFTARFAPL